MLHLLHTNQPKNITLNKNMRKSFTLVELIISLAIGTILIIATYNVMTESIATTQETSVAGTMDNYANRIQKIIKEELIAARGINVASTVNAHNMIDKTKGNPQGYNYENLYYVNSKELNFGIVYNEAEKRISIAYYPQGNRFLPASEQEFNEIKSVFSEEGANGVTIKDFKWNIDNYNINANNYNNPDYDSNSSKMVKFQVTLEKSYSTGKESLVKTYYFTEVVECAN